MSPTITQDSTPIAYHGSCHCGSITYTFTLPGMPSSWPLTKCNCSICHKCNFLHLRIPTPYISTFTVSTTSPDDLKDYTFNTHQIHHKSCSKCSVGLFRSWKVDGEEWLIVNVVTLDDVDLSGVGTNVGYLDRRGGDFTTGRQTEPVAPGAP
ncbi:hypothetical protein EV426DRAFT_618148 [Tirmania nivea]|nr:hypothetical protein EV426DRAFT_618148 [Tirmania nivea]